MNNCPYCGTLHQYICPLVKAMEYYPDGTIKRVEFKTALDYPKVDLPQGLPWGPSTSIAQW